MGNEKNRKLYQGCFYGNRNGTRKLYHDCFYRNRNGTRKLIDHDIGERCIWSTNGPHLRPLKEKYLIKLKFVATQFVKRLMENNLNKCVVDFYTF